LHPRGILDLDLRRYRASRTKLGLLLEPEPMAGALIEHAAPQPSDKLRQKRGESWVKIALIASSLLTLGFLVARMVPENFLSPWRFHQRQYRHMLAKSRDERQRKLADTFTTEIRQLDLPQLGTTDRCVSCHVGIDNPKMAGTAQPYAAHSGDYLQHHP